MRNETIVALLTVVTFAIGIIAAAVTASMHGSATTLYTNLLIVYGLFIVLAFAIAGAMARGRSKGSAIAQRQA